MTVDIEATRSELIDDFIDSITTSPDYIYDVARKGFTGYDNYSDQELIDEYVLVFCENPPEKEQDDE